jgi:hypothetical protein
MRIPASIEDLRKICDGRSIMLLAEIHLLHGAVGTGILDRHPRD